MHFLYLAASESVIRVLFTIHGYLHWRETGRCCTALSMSKLCHDWRSVGQSFLMSSPPVWEPRTTRFLLLSDRGGFVNVGRPLWRERLGLSFTVAAGPRQRSHSWVPSPAGLMTIILLSQIRDSSNLKDHVSIFKSPRDRMAQLCIPQELGSLFVASYVSQGYGGGIITRLHTRSTLKVNINPVRTSHETRCHMATSCCLLVTCVQGAVKTGGNHCALRQ